MGDGKWLRRGRRRAEKRSNAARGAAAGLGRRSLALESLEDRRMLATYLVNSLGDLNQDEEIVQGTLRWAIQQANAEDDRDTIVFSDNAFSGSGPGAISLNGGALTITQPLRILGPGPRKLTIQQTGANARVFDLNIGSDDEVFPVEISGVTISGGNVTGDDAKGGGILNRERLTMVETVIDGNGASAGGGGIFTAVGSTRIERSLIINNSGGGEGGGGVLNGSDSTENLPSTTIVNSTITGNFGGKWGGGVLNRNGSVNINNSTISENFAADEEAPGAGVASHGNLPPEEEGGEAPPETVFTTFYSSIVYGNDGNDVDRVGKVGEGEDEKETLPSVHSNGYNFVGTGNTTTPGDDFAFNAPGDKKDNPKLMPLDDYGGSTDVYLLEAGSPAINGGDPNVEPSPSEFDQRGRHFTRVAADPDDPRQAMIMDSGAAEVQLGQFVVDTLIDESDLIYSAIYTIDTIFGQPFVIPGYYDQEGDFGIREALLFAQKNPGQDTIRFSGNLITPEILDKEDPNFGPPTIRLTLGALSIDDDLIVEGPTGYTLEIDASGNDPSPGFNNGTGTRVIVIDDFDPTNFLDVVISNITIMGADQGGTGQGGGILNRENLTILNSTFKDNFASIAGGAIYAAAGSLTVVGSTFNNNASRDGGAIYVNSPVTGPANAATITSSTFSGNSASTRGGAIANSNSDLLIEFSTITLNTATTGLGNGVVNIGAGATTDVRSTIVSGNGNNQSDVAVSGAAASSFTSLGYNFIGKGNALAAFGAATHDLVNQTDPQLEPLMNTGGPTETHRPKVGSPVIDAGDPAAAAGAAGVPDFDQRGPDFIRVFDGNLDGTARIDIGAYELQGITLTVSTPIDENDGITSAGNLSLREAIELSNLNPLFDTIKFDPAMIGLLDPQDPVMFLGSGFLKSGTPADMRITDSVLIVNDMGLGTLAIDGSGLDHPSQTIQGSRIFTIDDGNAAKMLEVTFQGLEFRGAVSPTSGAAMFSREHLTLGDALDPQLGVRLIGNRTTGAGLHGGAIYQEGGQLDVFFSDISVNSTNGVDADGGAIYVLNGAAHIADTIISSNLVTLGNSDGGAIALKNSTLIADRSFITGNSAGPTGAGDGGGLFADGSSVTLNETFLSGNSTAGANSNGGGLAGLNSAIVLNDSSVTTNETNGSQSIGAGMFVSGGSLTLNRSQVWENVTKGLQSSGGGIAMQNAAVIVNDSSVFNNRVVGNSSHGGGVYNVGGVLIVRNSTISGNQAQHATAKGGGIYSDTNLAGTQLTQILNSTISGNSAPLRGGGVFNADGALEIKHSTVTNNSVLAANTGAGVASQANATTVTRVQSSIIAGNFVTMSGAQNTDVDFVDAAFTNSFQSLGYNVIGAGNAMAAFNAAGPTPDKKGIVNPLLAPLTNNGGLVETHALLDGSPAINAGSPSFNPNAYSPPLTTDQRGAGFARVNKDRIDVGAFESDLLPPLPGDFDDNSIVDGADFLAWQRGVGQPNATRPQGDANSDGLVNGADLGVWKNNFGSTGAIAASSSSTSAALSVASDVQAEASPQSTPDLSPLASLGTPGSSAGEADRATAPAWQARAYQAWDAALTTPPVRRAAVAASERLEAVSPPWASLASEDASDAHAAEDAAFAAWGDELL